MPKRLIMLFASVLAAGMFIVAPVVFAAPPGASQLKIFTRDREIIESSVNDWLESQQNITVDQVKASAYGNDYAVIISYREGGSGRVATRIKIFDSNVLTNNTGEDNKTPEIRGQEFVSLLGENQIIRSADILVGSGPWDIFVVYDEYNPIPSVTSEAQSAPIIEKIKKFINDVVSPSGGETGSETPVAPAESASTEAPTAATTTAESQGYAPGETLEPSCQPTDPGCDVVLPAGTSTPSTDQSAEPTEPPPTGESTTSEEQGEVLGAALISSLTASVFNATGSFLFNSNFGAIVFLLLVWVLIYFVRELIGKWKNKD